MNRAVPIPGRLRITLLRAAYLLVGGGLALVQIAGGALQPGMMDMLFACAFAIPVALFVPWGYSWRLISAGHSVGPVPDT